MAETGEPPSSGFVPDPGYREHYPWHAKTWATLTQGIARLPHAILLQGPAGLGKGAFAWRLAHFLLCVNRGADASACGTCHSCTLFAAGTHPDLLTVRPPEDSATIPVDQVREVRDFLALKPHTAAHKLVLLAPAEAMNVNAANALLKVLEEPPPGGVLVLVTAQPARLPATLRSRCSAIAFRAPAHADGRQWLDRQGVTGDLETALEQAGDAPLLALASIRSPNPVGHEQLRKDLEALQAGQDDPLRCATRWKNAGASYCLGWLQRHVADLIRAKMTGTDLPENSKKLSLNLKDLFKYSDAVAEAKNLLRGPLDEGLLLEDLLIQWHRISRRIG